MSEASSESVVGNRAAWIEEHKVGWRLGPLSKHVKGRGVARTGYELVLAPQTVEARHERTLSAVACSRLLGPAPARDGLEKRF